MRNAERIYEAAGEIPVVQSEVGKLNVVIDMPKIAGTKQLLRLNQFKTQGSVEACTRLLPN
jgi:hypothetical protein